MSNAFYQTVRGTRDQMARGFIGDIIRDVTTRTATGLNKEPQSKQVTTVGVPASPTAGATYSVAINGVVTTYAAENPTSQAAVGAGLAANINANPAIRGLASATYAGGTLTLTGRWPSVAFTVALPDAPAAPLTGPVSTNPAQSGAVIEFGRVLVNGGYTSTDPAGQNLLNVFVPTTDNLLAQVSTLTVTYAANEIYVASIRVRGQTYLFNVAGNTNTTTTATTIAAAINAQMPPDTVLAEAAAGVVTLTAEVKGQGFEIGIGTESGTAARLVLAHAVRGILTDITRCLAGISVRRTDVDNQTIDGNDPAYLKNKPVEYLRHGSVILQRALEEAIFPGDDIYIETDNTAGNAGRLYKTASPTRIKLPAAFLSWEFGDRPGEFDGIIRARLKQVA
ncbi:MAG: hypothetical protein AAFV53_28305 [Myxococcota bacterium]